MVKVPRSLEVSHTPLIALLPDAQPGELQSLPSRSSSFFARLEAVQAERISIADDVQSGMLERLGKERVMLEQVMRWIELQAPE